LHEILQSLAVVFLILIDPSSSDTLLEVYQIPRDAWAKEIEDIKPKLLQEDKSPAHEPTVTEEKV